MVRKEGDVGGDQDDQKWKFLCGGVFVCLGSLYGQSFCVARFLVWLGFCAARFLCGWDLCGHVAQHAQANSQKLDKQSVLPKKELCLLTNLRLLPPSSPYSLTSLTNHIRIVMFSLPV